MTTQLSLPLRRLGRTNKMVTPIGLGGAGLNDLYGKKSDDARAVACVHRALELGINYIDPGRLLLNPDKLLLMQSRATKEVNKVI